MWPMEKYISTSRKPTDHRSRRRIRGVSWSSSCCSSALGDDWAAPFSDAPYPAASTAAMTAEGSAVPSTPMELVKRLTEHAVTPGTFPTAFSTRAEQAAQLMPVTLYCLIGSTPISSAFAGWSPARR